MALVLMINEETRADRVAREMSFTGCWRFSSSMHYGSAAVPKRRRVSCVAWPIRCWRRPCAGSTKIRVEA